MDKQPLFLLCPQEQCFPEGALNQQLKRTFLGIVCSYLFGGTLQTRVPKRSGLSAAAKGQRKPLPSPQRPFSILPCTVFSLMFLSILIKSKSFFFPFDSMVHEGRASGGVGSRSRCFGLKFLILEVTAFYDAHSVSPAHSLQCVL